MSNVMHWSDLFFFVGFIMLAFVLVLLVWLYGRVSGSRSAARNVSAANLAEMAILFQTMRSVIHDQKSLAKDFNRSVDRKVTLIRQVVGKVAEEHNRMLQIQRDLERKFDEVGRELDAMRGEVVHLREELGLAASESKPTLDDDVPPLRIVAEPEDVEPPAELADLWVGFDFVSDDAAPSEIPETPPEAHGDPEVTRQAFRALLSMTADASRTDAKRETAAAEAVAVDAGNGRGRAASLRSRVYEYHDAGMSIAEIAHELGIGKGEIRLMLSLRQKGRR